MLRDRCLAYRQPVGPGARVSIAVIRTYGLPIIIRKLNYQFEIMLWAIAARKQQTSAVLSDPCYTQVKDVDRCVIFNVVYWGIQGIMYKCTMAAFVDMIDSNETVTVHSSMSIKRSISKYHPTLFKQKRRVRMTWLANLFIIRDFSGDMYSNWWLINMRFVRRNNSVVKVVLLQYKVAQRVLTIAFQLVRYRPIWYGLVKTPWFLLASSSDSR